MATTNPAMNRAVYRRPGLAATPAQAMTVPGTALKAALLMAILLVTAAYTGSQAATGSPAITYGLLIAGAIGGFLTALVTAFVPRVSPFTAPVYAALEGLVLGAVSAVSEAAYPGLVIQAVGLSVGVLAVMLVVYGTGVLRAAEKFQIGVVAATGAVCLVYVADIAVSFFGTRLPFIHESGAVGIGFSLVVVVIAALNLILDFDFIEQGPGSRPPGTWSGTAGSACWSPWSGSTWRSCGCWPRRGAAAGADPPRRGRAGGPPPGQQHLAGPARRLVHGPGRSDGTDQGRDPDEDAQ
jgi:uncharacterized YccA/Bax inhibitor family protein